MPDKKKSDEGFGNAIHTEITICMFIREYDYA